MSQRRFGSVVLGTSLVVGMAAFAAGRGSVRVEPSPMDVIPESVTDAVDAAATAAGDAATEAAGAAAELKPETSPAASSSASGSPAAARSAGVALVSATERESGVVRYAPFSGVSRAEWDMPVVRNARVERWITFLRGKNAERTHTWLEREGRWGGMIRAKLAERGMPQDLLYLTMIESGLSPVAYSHAHASGMWQFISETGRRYGLEIDSYVDERRDPIRATDAALDYLQDLHERFGSWYLAAAAYNSGENRVERILRQRAGGEKGREDLFWVIDDHLPRETRDYVPLMLAAGHIAKDPELYGFRDVRYQEPLSYQDVEVPGGVSIAAIAEAAGVDAEAVEGLNPHLKRGITPPGGSYVVRVPVGRKDAVLANLDRAVEETRLAVVQHRVRRGETLSHIAQRYGVRLSALQAANRGVSSRHLAVGQRIAVPADGASASSAGADVVYRVRRGDTLWEIARRHSVSVTELRRWNGIGSRIYPGQQIRIRS